MPRTQSEARRELVKRARTYAKLGTPEAAQALLSAADELGHADREAAKARHAHKEA